jgi:hypothetical protein
METTWIKSVGYSYALLLVAGTIICVAFTFFTCQKTGFLESLKEGAIFAVPSSLIPALVHYVPAVSRPFENVLRDYLYVPPEKAPMLGVGYIMMLIAWIMGARMIGSIQKAVCIPTPDEVAEFKARLQKKVAKEEQKEEKRNEEVTKQS